jgi:hypothetical protein
LTSPTKQLRALCSLLHRPTHSKHLGGVIKSHRHRGIKIKCKIVKLFQMNDVMARIRICMPRSMWKYIIARSRTPAPRAHNQQLHALSAFVYPYKYICLSPASIAEHKCVAPLCSPGAYCVWLDFLQAPIFSDIIQQRRRVLFVICIYEIITLSPLNQSIFIAMWAEGDVLMAHALIRINSSCCGQAKVRPADSRFNSLRLFSTLSSYFSMRFVQRISFLYAWFAKISVVNW